MDVGEAIGRAKTYVSEVFADEGVSSIRLEEVEYDEVDRAWLITLGLTRPSVRIRMQALAELPLQRDYRIVRLSDDGKGVPSVKLRRFPGEE